MLTVRCIYKCGTSEEADYKHGMAIGIDCGADYEGHRVLDREKHRLVKIVLFRKFLWWTSVLMKVYPTKII